MNAEAKLINFLKSHQAPRDPKDPSKCLRGSATHTSMGNHKGFYKGSYTIQPKEQAEFLRLYKAAVRDGMQIGINETHVGVDYAPFLIDLDMLFPLESDVQDELVGDSGDSGDSDTASVSSRVSVKSTSSVQSAKSCASRSSVKSTVSRTSVKSTASRSSVKSTVSKKSTASKASVKSCASKVSVKSKASAVSGLHPSSLKLERRFTPDDVKNIVERLTLIIKKYVDVSRPKVKAFVFMRDAPYIKKGELKDGIHIIYPFVSTPQHVQKFVRGKFMQDTKLQKIFQRIGVTNPIEKILDESPITQNWLLYGSCKYDGDIGTTREPYDLQYVFNSKMDEMDKETYLQKDMTTLMSIRNKKIKSDLKKEYQPDISAFLQELKNRPKVSQTAVSSQTTSRANSIASSYEQLLKEQVDTLKKSACTSTLYDRKKYTTLSHIIHNLSVTRAEGYTTWIEVGMALKNIDESLFDLWVEFSKRAPNKFDGEEVCRKQWNGFTNQHRDGYGYGSLMMWLKTDNEDEYKYVCGNPVWKLIDKSLFGNGPSHSVAQVLYAMHPEDYVCICPKKKEWYYYEGHYWHTDPVGSKIRDRITKDLYIEFKAYSQYLANRVATSDGSGGDDSMAAFAADVTEYASCVKKMGVIDKVIPKLQSGSFINDVMNELGFIYYEQNNGLKFLEDLDKDPNLLCFENGVFDLKNMHFRAGRPQDMCGRSTGYNYEVLPPDHPDRVAVRDFMEQILVQSDVRDYVWQLIAYSCDGNISYEIFPIFSGSGGNGKSKLIELWGYALGDYMTDITVSLLTNKRAKADAANPELFKIKGCRFVWMSEPEKGSRLNTDYMKQLTGGDKVSVRGLYSNPVSFKPMCLFIMMCNDMPEIKTDDNGTWRRLRRVVFKSEFVEFPDENNKYQFKLDPHLNQCLPGWKVAFMNEVFAHRIQALAQGEFKLQEPARVKKYTQEYRKVNDHFCDFISENIEPRPGCKLSLKDISSRFREWFKENYPGEKVPGKAELNGYLVRKYGKPEDKNSPVTCYWKDLSFIHQEAEANFDED